MKIYTHEWYDHKTIYINDDCGFCKINIYDEPEQKIAELYDLIIYPEHRGNGDGDWLLTQATLAAKEENCDVLVLWPDCELWVEDWYKRHGFKENPKYQSSNNVPGWAKILKEE